LTCQKNPTLSRRKSHHLGRRVTGLSSCFVSLSRSVSLLGSLPLVCISPSIDLSLSLISNLTLSVSLCFGKRRGKTRRKEEEEERREGRVGVFSTKEKFGFISREVITNLIIKFV